MSLSETRNQECIEFSAVKRNSWSLESYQLLWTGPGNGMAMVSGKIEHLATKIESVIGGYNAEGSLKRAEFMQGFHGYGKDDPALLSAGEFSYLKKILEKKCPGVELVYPHFEHD